MIHLRFLITRVLLVFAGMAVPLLCLWLAALAAGEKPLEPWERLALLNRQQLGYDGIESLCRPQEGRPPAPDGIDVFGGSSVYGSFATQGADFPRELGRRLERRFPGRWNVRNLGVVAKSSYFVKACMKLAAGDGARTWIVYEGHNDFIDIAGQHIELTRFFLEHPMFANVLEPLLASSFSAALRPFFRLAPGRNYAEHRQRVARVLEISETNYREMIALARANGKKLVLSTVLSNLEYAPDVPAPGTPEDDRADVAYSRAMRAYRRGDAAEGYRLLGRARDLDPLLWRAPSGFNELMRRLAAENPGVVTLLDLEDAARKAFGGKPLGCNLFGQDGHCDRLHPNDALHKWIADQLERALFPVN